MEEELLYSGEVSAEVYEEVSEVVDEFSPQWKSADVDLILEESGEQSLKVRGPEAINLFKPWDTVQYSETYELDGEGAEDLRDSFS